MTQLPAIHLSTPRGPEGAPLVVLAHSLGTGPLIWEKATPILSERYRVSLMTLPGHGGLPAPAEPFTMNDLADATAAAISEIGGETAFFAGVSIGGALTLTLALRHGELFAAVAPIAAAAAMGGAQHWDARAAMVREQSTSALVADSEQRWFAPESLVNEPEFVERILETLRDTSSEGYARCAEALGTYDLSAELSDIRVPLLAIGGEHDSVAPRGSIKEIADQVPGARMIIIPGSGHQPPAEAPERVAVELVQFFGQVQ